MTGTFITFEGIEGAGKSTQIELLAARLKENGISVLCTREPGGTKLGEGVRDLVLNPKHKDLFPMSELFLMEAARSQHVTTRIMPALDRGQVVLCDRFSDSTLVYQGDGRGLDWKMIEKMNQIASQGLRPDITLLLDLDVGTGLERTENRSGKQSPVSNSTKGSEGASRFDLEAVDFLAEVIPFYKIASADITNIPLLFIKIF